MFSLFSSADVENDHPESGSALEMWTPSFGSSSYIINKNKTFMNIGSKISSTHFVKLQEIFTIKFLSVHSLKHLMKGLFFKAEKIFKKYH